MGHVIRPVLHVLGAFIECDVVHSHLHWAEQVVVHHRDVNGLMNNQNDWHTACRAITRQRGRNKIEVLDFALRGIKARDIDLLV